MGDLPVAAESVEAPEAKPLPPLRIHHFFLWTIAVAAVFSSYQLIHFPGAGIALGSEATEAISVFYYVPQAIALPTLLVGFYWRYRGLPFLSEPGHWLMLVILIEAIHEAYALMNFSTWTNYSTTVRRFFLMILPAWCAFLVVAVIYFVQWREKRFHRPWRRFFLVVFTIEMIQMALNLLSVQFLSYFTYIGSDLTFAFFGGMQVILPLSSIIFASVAMRGDISLGIHRHWSNWCGAISWTAMLVMQLLGWSYYVWWILNGGLNKVLGS